MQSLDIKLVLLAYLFLVNITAYLMIWRDKRKARKKEWRVAEVTLLLMSFIGGAIGLLVGILTLRHKTQKTSFKVAALLGLIMSFFIYYIVFRIVTFGPISLV